MPRKPRPTLDDLTDGQRDALRRFAAKNGPHWRSELLSVWSSGRDEKLPDGGFLRQIRNNHGPSWLNNLREKP